MIKEYQWTVEQVSNPSVVEKFSRETNIPLILSKILVNRGIDSFEKAKIFFRPDYSHLHDPFLMKGMHKAVERIIKAIDSREKILIYGDYDVDGTTGIAMLYLFFKSLNLDVHYHVPNRFKEGYGISEPGIDNARSLGINLLIAIDCGITAKAEVEYAKKYGIDIIIVDHHEPTFDIPDAVAVLDPLLPDCPYPFKKLSGTGVGFKLIQAIARKLGKEEITFEYLDFVTLATAADIVPLVGENRIMVKLGLKQIKDNPRPGLKELIDVAKLKIQDFTTSHIVFGIAPRINAVGRLGDAKLAVQLLISQDHKQAHELATILESKNIERRKIDEETFNNAQKLIENFLDIENDFSILLHQDDWHLGVIGIVASRLVEKYHLPTIMMTTVDGVIKGSARSIPGFDIYQALKKVEDKLIQFGGHKYAAGISVEIEKLEEFKKAFNDTVRELMNDEKLKPEIKIDSELEFSDITEKFLKVLHRLAPFGPENLRPVFLIKNVLLSSEPEVFSKNHLLLKLKYQQKIYDAVGFNLGDWKDKLSSAYKSKIPIDIVFSITENTREVSDSKISKIVFPQFKLKDLRINNVV